ncbi:MAG: hypothetical protein ABRQ39_27445 [Candidatus Eremiobacterota bacterium]
MKRKIFLSLLLLVLIILFIISYGCGGGSDIIQPSSLLTPNSDDITYLTIKVEWPEEDQGNIIISSENEKDITASMPSDAKKIIVKIFDFRGKNPDNSINFNDPNNVLLGEGSGLRDGTVTVISVPIKNTLSSIPIKIWAGAFSDLNETLPDKALSSTEHFMILKAGNQTANLQLGDYDLTLTADRNTVDLPSVSRHNTNIVFETPTPGDTPTPGTGGPVSINITAKLNIVYPTPANTLTPNPTPKPVAGKPITFEIIGGNDGVI